MRIVLLLLFLVAANGTRVWAGNEARNYGAGALAVGGTLLGARSPLGLYQNPAFIQDCRLPTVATSVENSFGLAGFNGFALAGTRPLSPKLSAAAGVHRFGNSLFGETGLSLAMAAKAGFTTFGAVLQMLSNGFANGQQSSAVSIGMGGKVQLHSTLALAAAVYNINEPRVARRQSGERAPARLSAAILYSFSPKVQSSLQVEKHSNQDPNYALGLAYQALDKVTFRAGFASKNAAFSGGIGLRLRTFYVDYGASFEGAIGIRQGVTCSFAFPIKQKVPAPSFSESPINEGIL